MPNIKICLSSRPLNIFEDAYGGSPDHKLYIQDVPTKPSEPTSKITPTSYWSNDGSELFSYVLNDIVFFAR
ncbi:hypothetical protein BCR34DRAFT_554240 [Clohesyomyces aquaticus]|uniref:Uncharacterized protein n=1 Tax=Clohesyomyces aquaticus TaxID=1231657 RepID=A0A1Y2A6L2_9PLEO|nr:hypothetical protein BCR34DRAFT_554240 [Clohesyomyces aquaticus]